MLEIVQNHFMYLVVCGAVETFEGFFVCRCLSTIGVSMQHHLMMAEMGTIMVRHGRAYHSAALLPAAALLSGTSFQAHSAQSCCEISTTASAFAPAPAAPSAPAPAAAVALAACAAETWLALVPFLFLGPTGRPGFLRGRWLSSASCRLAASACSCKGARAAASAGLSGSRSASSSSDRGLGS